MISCQHLFWAYVGWCVGSFVLHLLDMNFPWTQAHVAITAYTFILMCVALGNAKREKKDGP